MPKQINHDPNKPANDKQETSPQIIGRPDIPTLFIDKFIFTKRPDGNILFNGIQSVPGFEVEQLRFIISNDHTKRFIEKLAQHIDFYPEKQPVSSPSSKDTNIAKTDKKTKTGKAGGNSSSKKAKTGKAGGNSSSKKASQKTKK